MIDQPPGSPDGPGPGPGRPLGFGGQVRLLRTARGLTAAALAARCGVSRSLVSQIETGRISPSLNVVRQLAGALGVPIAALFAADGPPADLGPATVLQQGSAPLGGRPAAGPPFVPATPATSATGPNGADPPPAPQGLTAAGPGELRIGLVRRDERKGLRLPRSRITYELLSPDLRGRLQVQWVELSPGETGPVDGFVHSGEECYVVLQGCIRFRVGDREFTLHAGDALTFDSSVPHRAINDGPEPAVAISAMTPPSF